MAVGSAWQLALLLIGDSPAVRSSLRWRFSDRAQASWSARSPLPLLLVANPSLRIPDGS